MGDVVNFSGILDHDRTIAPPSDTITRASARLDAVIATHNRPPRRHRRRRALAIAVIAIAAVSAPALGTVFRGTQAHRTTAKIPVPLLAQAMLSHADPPVPVDEAHTALEITTSAGVTADLVVTPGRQGGSCWGLYFFQDHASPGTGTLGCPAPGGFQTPPGLVKYVTGTRIDGVWIGLVAGLVPPGANSIDFRGADGLTAPIGTADGYFLGEVPTWNTSVDVVALDAGGNTIASSTARATPPPAPTAPATVFATRTVDGVTLTASTYVASDGRSCVNLSDAGLHDEGHFLCLSAAPMTLVGPQSWPTAGQTTLMTVAGTVPPGTARVRLDFNDGSHATASVKNGGFLYAAEQNPMLPPATSVNVTAVDGRGVAIAQASA